MENSLKQAILVASRLVQDPKAYPKVIAYTLHFAINYIHDKQKLNKLLASGTLPTIVAECMRIDQQFGNKLLNVIYA